MRRGLIKEPPTIRMYFHFRLLLSNMVEQRALEQSDIDDVIKFEPLENPPWRRQADSKATIREYAATVREMVGEIVEFQRKASKRETTEADLNKIRDHFLHKYIFNVNSEEDHGVGTVEETIECIKTVESGGQSERVSTQEQQETMNTYKAYKRLQKRVKEDCNSDKQLYGLIESSIVKEIHKIILDGIVLKEGMTQAGKCSSKERYTTYKGEQHRYQQPDDMDKALDTLLDRYNSLIHCLKHDKDDVSRTYKLFKTSSWLLFELLDLHPFADGNGRLCRLLCNYALSVFTPFPTPIYNIWSESCKDDYVQALVDARKSSDRHPRALTTMLIECNWLGWKEYFQQLPI